MWALPLVTAAISDIAVHLSDRAAALFPPHDTPAQQALARQGRQWKDSAAGPWDRAEVRRHVLGGGGTDELFERAFGELVGEFNREQQGIAVGTFHAGFGGVTYLVSGRKA